MKFKTGTFLKEYIAQPISRQSGRTKSTLALLEEYVNALEEGREEFEFSFGFIEVDVNDIIDKEN